MRIQMQEGDDASRLHHGRWELGLAGAAVDERGAAAIDYTSKYADEVRSVTYDPELFTIAIESESRYAEQVEDLLGAEKSRSIILEATTFGFVEIFLCARALRSFV